MVGVRAGAEVRASLGSPLGTCIMSQGRPGRPFLVRSVTVTIDGVTHHGTYYVQGSVVHVRSSRGEKITKLGRSPPEAIARLLLSELAREAKR